MAALAVVCVTQAIPNVRRLTGPPPAEVGEWIDAVNRHVPGTADLPAIEAGSWSHARLRGVVLPRIEQLAGDTWDNALLKRGAMLHTDIALLQLGTSDLRGHDAVIQSRDSLSQGLSRSNAHLDVARDVLGWVEPAPRQDRDVELWYRAITASLAASDQLGDLTYHLNPARTLFTGAAWFHLAAGCLAETMASPRIEAVTGAFNHGQHLAEAERGFRRSIELDPSLVEAHIRLAHVHVLRGRPERALAETLRAGDLADPRLQYFALLIRGRALEAAGRFADARTAFESAALLYPSARAPITALSRVLLAAGDVAGAARAAERGLAMVTPTSLDDDPWWTYDRCSGPEADGWLEQLRTRILSLTP